MQIKIFGTGCPNCQHLERNTKDALRQLGIEAEIEKLSEIQDIINYGIMSTPALVIDGIVLVSGMVPNVDDIREKINKHSKK